MSKGRYNQSVSPRANRQVYMPLTQTRPRKRSQDATGRWRDPVLRPGRILKRWPNASRRYRRPRAAPADKAGEADLVVPASIHGM